MSELKLARESMFLEEATISNMREIAALVELRERLGGIVEMGHRIGRG